MTQVPASSHGGGFTPVSCVLARSAFDIHAADTVAVPWNSLVNNVVDFTVLAAIPSGLGLAFVFDGSDGTITTTAAGTWALTYFVSLPNSDATLRAALKDPWASRTEESGIVSLASGGITLTTIDTLPSGASGTYNIYTAVAATANPYNITANLSIVRLA